MPHLPIVFAFQVPGGRWPDLNLNVIQEISLQIVGDFLWFLTLLTPPWISSCSSICFSWTCVEINLTMKNLILNGCLVWSKYTYYCCPSMHFKLTSQSQSLPCLEWLPGIGWQATTLEKHCDEMRIFVSDFQIFVF